MPPKSSTKTVGEIGEDHAADYLERCGYRIIERNWKFRRGELDIICVKGPQLVVAEVKSRRDSAYARRYLLDNITGTKRHKLRNLSLLAGRRFMRRLGCSSLRIDVIGVLIEPTTGNLTELRHLRAAVGARE